MKIFPSNYLRKAAKNSSIAIFLILLTFPLTAQARDIIDMSGKMVTIPDTITKVVAVSPPGTYLLYAIDPLLIGGLNFPPWEDERKFTVKEYSKLPVIGGLAGQSRNINREVLLQVKPDFIVYWAWRDDATSNKFLESLTPLHFPLVSVRLNSINDYPEALRFMGDAVNRKERGETLSKYATNTLTEAQAACARIPDDKKITVYYAEGTDGLSTEPEGSLHAELIPLAGGINVHKGEEVDHMGMEKISMEQLLLYDPEVILVKEKAFFDTVYTEPRWKNLRAVREKHVYHIPCVPFNWFDRPPSYMRLLGIKWLLNTLHPDFYTIDMVAETRTFYKLFLGVDLSDKDTLEVLNR